MGSKKSSQPAPQPVVSVPQAPTMGQNIQEYIKYYPELFELQQKYSPQEAQLDLELMQDYGPQYADYLAQEQQRLTPYTYGLQEQLAQMASENAGGQLPPALQNAYLDQYRAEIGQNVGSPIGADYVSNNLARTAEDYRRNYQNLGLSLLGRTPSSSYAPSTPQFENPIGGFGFGDLAKINAQNYGTYVGGLTNVPYYTQAPQSGFNWGGAISSGLGAARTIGSFF